MTAGLPVLLPQDLYVYIDWTRLQGGMEETIIFASTYDKPW